MNRRDLDALRRRLEGRSAAAGDDHPLLLWVGALLFVLLVVLIFSMGSV